MFSLNNYIFNKINLNGNLSVENRIVLPPMCTYKAENDGVPNTFHQIHYGARALSGVGLIIVEATAVEPRGRISSNDLGLWNEAQIKGHQMITLACHAFESKIFVQLAHAGRKAFAENETIVAPSAIPFSENYKKPSEMSTQDIEDVKNAFVNAAIFAEKSGYDGVELHAAHGYLLHSFLSPITNLRNDQYGGTFENNLRFIKDIIAAIKGKSNLPIGIRISATDWMQGGWKIVDSIRLIQALEKDLVYVHVSAGGIYHNPDELPKIEPMYLIKYAQQIKENVNIPVIGVGLITKVEEINTILESAACDMVAVGREMLRNPNFPQYAAQKMGVKEKINAAYTRGFII